MQRHFALMGQPRRHPFRSYVGRVTVRQQRMRDDSDVRLFVLSFFAFFVSISTFIL